MPGLSQAGRAIHPPAWPIPWGVINYAADYRSASSDLSQKADSEPCLLCDAAPGLRATVKAASRRAPSDAGDQYKSGSEADNPRTALRQLPVHNVRGYLRTGHG